jgi:arsenate reductase (thioredoxin)
MSDKRRVLFLCTGNACRQMAEGLCRHFHGDEVEPLSAGIEAHGLDPLAVRVMAEIGIDISTQRSKTLADLGDRPVDVVVTVCGHAARHCPVFPGHAEVVHQGFDDPPNLAASAQSEDEALGHYRRVRDEIRAWLDAGPGALRG